MEIELGQRVRDKVTGFTGIATAKVRYINGCVQYCVAPKIGADGKMPESEYLDVQRLEILSSGVRTSASDTGGPQRDCPRH